MKSVSFSEFADFIRVSGHIPKSKQIDPETQFERDLGITGRVPILCAPIDSRQAR
jgi:hypothetical protein